MRFSSSVENWRDKFFKLKKRYKKLMKESHKLKRSLYDDGTVYVPGDFENDQDKTTDVKRYVTIDKGEELKSPITDDRKKIANTFSTNECPDMIVLNDDATPEIKTYDFTSSSNLQVDHPDLMMSSYSHKKPSDSNNNSAQEEETEVDKDVNKEKVDIEDELDPSWKRANRALLHGKLSSKVRYIESGKKLSVNKSIHEFFRPHSICKVRSISSKRSRRQMTESSVELPRMKKLKEENERLSNEVGGSLKLIESVVETEDSFVDSNCINATDELDIEVTSCKTQKHPIGLGNKPKRDPEVSGNNVKLTSIRDRQGQSERAIDASAPSHASRKEDNHSRSKDIIEIDNNAMCWSLNEVVGLPSSASTPMIYVEDDQKCHQNTKDLEDTMWSAPESPSVVRSIFSISNEEDNDTSTEADKAEVQHDDVHFKVPREGPNKVLQTESQSFITEISNDLNQKSRNKNTTCKTSDGDLSADMFYGNTEDNNTPEGNIETKRVGMERESHIARIVLEEKAVDTMFDESTCFQRPKDNVKYKFNAVIRKRDERDKLDGYACAECAAWYEDEEDDEEKRKHLRKVCRHKAVSSPPPSTPDGFWSIQFPDTPVYMKRGLMLNEDDTLPLHARPKKRKDRTEKIRDREIQKTYSK